MRWMSTDGRSCEAAQTIERDLQQAAAPTNTTRRVRLRPGTDGMTDPDRHPRVRCTTTEPPDASGTWSDRSPPSGTDDRTDGVAELR